MKHNLGKSVAVAMAAAGIVAGVAGTASATPLPGALRIKASSAVAVASCSVSFNGLRAGGFNTFWNGSIKSTGLNSLTNTASGVFCDLYDSSYYTYLDTAHKAANASGTAFTSSRPELYAPSYHLCAWGYTISRSGVTTYTSYNCTP